MAEEANLALMLVAALVAFVHFLAFFALAAALVVELVLISQTMTIAVASRIRRADRAAGLSALTLLIFGFLRVSYFEKGGDYYFNNSFFQLKILLFVGVFVLTIYPTSRFIRWGPELAENRVPVLSAIEAKKIKRIIHWQLVLIGGMALCASLMAKGFGF